LTQLADQIELLAGQIGRLEREIVAQAKHSMTICVG
jgi:hypothetical protein